MFNHVSQLLKYWKNNVRSVKCSSSLPRCAYYPVRPQLHVVGIIIHGHIEAYYIMDADQPKDSSMNCTIVAQALDKVKGILGPDQALPRNLVIAADNTTLESKNTVFANFLSYLVTTEVFESVEVQFLQANRAQSVMPGKDCAGGRGPKANYSHFDFASLPGRRTLLFSAMWLMPSSAEAGRKTTEGQRKRKSVCMSVEGSGRSAEGEWKVSKQQ